MITSLVSEPRCFEGAFEGNLRKTENRVLVYLNSQFQRTGDRFLSISFVARISDYNNQKLTESLIIVIRNLNKKRSNQAKFGEKKIATGLKLKKQMKMINVKVTPT